MLRENLDHRIFLLIHPLPAGLSQAHPLVAIRTAIGMGVFDAFAAAGGAELTVDELNEKTKGDKALLVRIMRLLSANRLFTETGVDKYRPQPLALGFATGAPPGEMIKICRWPNSNSRKDIDEMAYMKFKGVNPKTKKPEDREVKLKEWMDKLPKGEDLLAHADEVIDGQIGELKSAREELLNSKRIVPLFEFRDIGSAPSSHFQKVVDDIEDSLVTLHKKYSK
ncbi:uncharacterized protein KD926_009843 [Aspergillus affinis]|uniref:uncharacterized protein n=1 Tax=Aspergillus affinis TaxID=1070780 RepID=UPI0022FE8B18|nr:S-adenosyl-L-methionine-dependent methyltransferase [Aspergillus affinis]KAI9039209.1 S-adenosyl-L-methionine-dependent methyltransferase [Aspergillus affinis]